MKKNMRSLAVLGAALVAAYASASVTADFEDLSLAPNSYVDNSNGFSSEGLGFNNVFTDFGGGFTTWAGFAYSNVNDATTPGFGNQYAAITGTGFGSTGNYGVAFEDTFSPVTPTITLPSGHDPLGVYVTNTTYAALSMRDGDGFAKKFGGASGNDADWFLLTATGWSGASQTGTAQFYLADYRFANNAQDYIVNTWQWFDLSGLGSASSITFSLTSSDNGAFGMNTPAYFALDNVTAAPEPASMLALCLGVAGAIRARKGVRK